MKKIISFVLTVLLSVMMFGCGSKDVIDEALFYDDAPEFISGFQPTGTDISFLSRIAVFDRSNPSDVVIRVDISEPITKVDISGTMLSSEQYQYRNKKLIIKKSFFDIYKSEMDRVLNIKCGTKKGSIPLVIATKIIKSPFEFLAINTDRASLDGYYVLGADIDFLGFDFTMIGNKSVDNTTDQNLYSFNGLLDGAGFSLKNITLDRTFSGKDAEQGFIAGVFRNTGGRSVIRNLNLLNFNFNCSGGIMGGLVGINGGKIENCFVDGTLTTSGDYNEPCGGVVGFNTGSIINCVANVRIEGQLIAGMNFAAIDDTFGFAKSGSRLLNIGEKYHADAEDEFPEGFQCLNNITIDIFEGITYRCGIFDTADQLKKPSNFIEFNELYWDLSGEYTIKLQKMFLSNT